MSEDTRYFRASNHHAEAVVRSLTAEEVRAGVLKGRQMLPREVCRILMDRSVWAYNPDRLHHWTEFDKIADMCAICYGESAGYTEAENGNNDGSLDLGFFQLNSVHKPKTWTMERWREYCFDPYQCIYTVRKLYYPNRDDLGKVWYAFPVVNRPDRVHRFYGPAYAGIINSAAVRRGWSPVPHYRYA